ncbi:MAG: hypothetical protein KKD05_11480 [Candidatus Omnitrophica bacterium]|nr:hypothetical protein [Candidatus Omnitrophota bacterium]
MYSSKTTWIFFCVCVFVFLFNFNAYSAGEEQSFSLKIKNNLISTQLDSVEVTKINNYHRVKIKGLENFAAPGEPLLPIKTIKYLIPQGKKVSNVTLGWTSKKYVYGTYFVEPAQAPARTDYAGPINPTLPNPEIYSRNTAYPESVYKVVSTQEMRGYKILIINLFPVEYIPATGKLAYYDNLNLNIVLSDELATLSTNNKFYRGIAADQKAVNDFVDNPEDISTYSQNAITSLAAPLATVDYLIITSLGFKNYVGVNNLNDLKTHKESKGISTEIFDTTWVYANYTAKSDNAGNLRDFIIAYCTDNLTQYVLLVGDADGGGIATGETEAAPIIPYRGFYGKVNNDYPAHLDPDNNIPCDMYYACFDGDFDFNNNGIYGEIGDGPGGGSIDLTAEVYIGRAPVDSTAELANFVKKTIAYENSNADYLTRACMAGELVTDTYAKPYLEEIRNGSSANGYSTSGMSESGYFSFNNLYDQDATWITSSLVAIINAGVHVINHLGHATNTVVAKTMSNADVDGLTNTEYFFGYTQGCYSGAFDNRQSDGIYGASDCILEHFTTEANGAFSFIGNSRYGWYNPGGTNGASQRIHREFWDSVVRDGNVNIGKALQLAKQETIGLVASYDAERWAYFATNLLGDPQTPLSAAFLSPTNFTANNIAFANSSWVTLSWKNSIRADLTQVMIRYRTDGTYPTSETDGTLLVSKAATPGTTETYNHTDVKADTTYHYVAFGYNGTTYEGAVAANNRASTTVLGGSGSADSSSSSSSCFVATACYGDQQAPEVVLLRKFRDKQLMADYRGREFVAVYYIIGPKLADMIRANDAAKKAVRYGLSSLVKLADLLNKGDL